MAGTTTQIPGERVGGYLASAAAFAGITAAWAFIVRDDAYYQWTELFGFRLPIATVAYLVTMPIAGFVLGRWRYQRRHVGSAGPGFIAKLFARAIQFTYAHSLLVLFTAAMMTDYFLGLNIDDQIRSIDDRMFDLGARFAPWLSAYLAGFNLGRAAGLAAARNGGNDPDTDNYEIRSLGAKPTKEKRAEPSFGEPMLAAGETGDLGSFDAEVESAVLEPDGADDGPGFLPPQDVDRLRPGLTQLR
jgi:hypothetical protein